MDMNISEELVAAVKSEKEYEMLIKFMALLEKADDLEAVKQAIKQWLELKAK